MTATFEKTTTIPLFGIPIDLLPEYRQKDQIGTKPTEEHEGLNKDLLVRIFDFIQEHPTTWRQDDWFKVVDRESGSATYYKETNTYEEKNSCGAAFCFAGHVALAEGFPAPPKNNGQLWERDVDGTYYKESVSDFAQKRLGLTYMQAEELFDGDNSMKDLQRLVLLLVATDGKVDCHTMTDVRMLEENADSDFLRILTEEITATHTSK